MPALMDEGVRSALVHSETKMSAGSRKGSYMSTMTELRAGLTEGQRAHAAKQRQQLQQDLEQQVSLLSLQSCVIFDCRYRTPLVQKSIRFCSSIFAVHSSNNALLKRTKGYQQAVDLAVDLHSESISTILLER